MTGNLSVLSSLPDWLPDAARLYLHHTEQGLSLRHLARREGCHASTVMRQVRRYELRREDPLVDEALSAFGGQAGFAPSDPSAKDVPMNAVMPTINAAPDDATIARESARILRRLAEAETVLAIAQDMDKAVVLRSFPDGQTARLAVVDRVVAQVFALKEWITCRKPGRVATYAITPSGRAEARRLCGDLRGMSEAPAAFAGREEVNEDEKRPRYALPESPVAVLARRRDSNGAPFLTADLVLAAERLLEDFELSQIGDRQVQNWDAFLAKAAGDVTDEKPQGRVDARDRVARALRDLGPGLGDVVLRCCCYLEGLETAERRMGWSARSGKIVLRIALQRLRLHYQETYGKYAPLIG